MQTYLPPQYWGCESVSHHCHIAIILPFYTSECFPSCCWLVLLWAVHASSPTRSSSAFRKQFTLHCSAQVPLLLLWGTLRAGHPISATPRELLTPLPLSQGASWQKQQRLEKPRQLSQPLWTEAQGHHLSPTLPLPREGVWSCRAALRALQESSGAQLGRGMAGATSHSQQQGRGTGDTCSSYFFRYPNKFLTLHTEGLH